MKKTRLIATLLVLVLALSLFAGCGGGSTPATQAPATQAPATQAPAEGEKAEEAPPEEPPSDEVISIVVQVFDPATSICGQYVTDWCEKVKEASGGRLDFVAYFGGSLVSAPESVDAVRDGIADMCWTAANVHSGQFPVSEGVMTPLSGVVNARMGADVMMDMYNEMPEMQQEYADFKVLMLTTCSYGPLSMTSKKAETIEDFKGLRMRAPGTTVIAWAEAVGISPMTVPTPETYEQLQKSVIDGCMNDWHNIAAQKLTDLLNYICDYPVTCSPLMMIMNKDKFASLPEDLQKVIDDHSGAYASKMAGIYWDSTRGWVYDNADELGVEIYDPSPELIAAFEAPKEQVHDSYIAYLDSKGLNGQAVYDKMMEIISRHEGVYDFESPVNIEDFQG